MTSAALVGLLVLVVAMVWLARRTHRYLNLPLVAAAAVLAVYLVVAVSAMSSLSSTVASAQRGPYAQARALSEARIAAFDAKANESLTLVARGSGASFEAAWQASAQTVVDPARGGRQRAGRARRPAAPGRLERLRGPARADPGRRRRR